MALDKEITAFFDKTGDAYIKHELPVWGAQEALKRFPAVNADSIVHDHASGPGTATMILMANCAAAGITPPKIFATDVSEGMINVLRKRAEQEGWSNVEAQVMDGKELDGLEDDRFTHSITGMAVNMTGSKGIYRTLRPGGTAVATHWKRQPLLEVADAIRHELHPRLPKFPPGFLPEWWKEDFLLNTMKDGGFKNVKIDLLTLVKDYKSADKLVEEFQIDFFMMARNGLTDSEKERWDDTLREYLKKRGSFVFEFELLCAIATK